MLIKASRYYGALLEMQVKKERDWHWSRKPMMLIAETVGWNRKSYFKMADTDKKTHISAPRQDSWTIQNVITLFSDRETQFN